MTDEQYPYDEDLERETLRPLIARWFVEASGMRPTTRIHYRYTLWTLSEIHGARDLRSLGSSIERFIASRQDSAPSYQRSAYVVSRSFCTWLRRTGKIKVNPTDDIPAPKKPHAVPRALSTEDVATLFASLPDQRARTVISLMVQEGLRCLEVAGLEWSDIDLVHRTMILRGKGGHERLIPITDATLAELNKLQRDGNRRRGGGPVIRSVRGGKLASTTISDYVSRWMKAAGIWGDQWDGTSAHALRHTAASDVYRTTRDPVLVQAMLGHQNLDTTRIYLRHANLDDMAAGMAGRSYEAQP